MSNQTIVFFWYKKIFYKITYLVTKASTKSNYYCIHLTIVINNLVMSYKI